MPKRKPIISAAQTGRFPSDKPNFSNRPQRDGEPSHWTLKQVLPYLHCYKDDPDGPYQFIQSLITANPAAPDALQSTDQAIIHEVKKRAATFVQDNSIFRRMFIDDGFAETIISDKEASVLIESAMLIGVSISMEIAAAQSLASLHQSPGMMGEYGGGSEPERASDRHMRAHCDGSADAE